MKIMKLIVFLILITTETFAQNKVEERVNEIMSKMTLEEKVGQMTQITLDVICKGKYFDDNKEMELDPEMLRKALVQYHVGSIFNTGTYTLSREKWNHIISEIQKVATKETRLKIPVIYGIDAIHGATYTEGSTMFPQEIGLAATWNPEFAEQMGSVTAYEVRASSIPWNFSPVMDLSRQPLWSRVFETLGEDPYLASEMGKAIVKGYQGEDVSNPEKVAACLKHYVGYSNSKSGKDRTPIAMSERELREYYLVPFKAAIENGAQTVMINSAEINGTPVHIDKHILTDILKDELKFDGFAVTDWEDIVMLHTVHKVAASEKEAVKMAINAGIDMSMVPLKFDFADHLVELVKEGSVPMARVDDAVRRILRVKVRLGLFETPVTHYKNYKKFGSAEFVQQSYNAALESITLLKNEKELLPLKKDKKVLVAGVGGNSLNDLNGAWTYTWQGVISKFNPKEKKTVYQAIKDKIGEEKAFFVQGTSYDKDINIQEAVIKSKEVDYVVVCLGEMPSTEKIGDINDLTFEKAQLDLIKELSKTGKPIIAVLLVSRPRIFTEVEPLISSVVHAYRPSNEGGRALADILFGDANPSGKLPYTYPRYPNDLVLYDHKNSEKRDKDFGFNAFNPLYEFGTGLSYTKFEYSDLLVDKKTFSDLDSVRVSVKVSNKGNLTGKEVVQLYSKDHFASITPSARRLRSFEKVELKPRESKTLTFVIDKHDLAFVNKELAWVTEPGKFDLIIGPLKQEIEFISKPSIAENGANEK